MTIKLYPATLSGAVAAPPAKSYAHRALVAAALADGVSEIQNIGSSDDVLSTIEAVKALGAVVDIKNGTAYVTGPARPPKDEVLLNCNESGATFRFLLPVAAALGARVHFTGSGQLAARPARPLIDVLAEHGAAISGGGLPFHLGGALFPGEYSLTGGVSSQFISGLLLGLPVLGRACTLRWSLPLVSAPYVDMTVALQKAFGVDILLLPGRAVVPAGQRYTPANFVVEGDYSSAAVFLTAGALGHSVNINGLNPESLQADRLLLAFLQSSSAHITHTQNGLSLKGTGLSSFHFDTGPAPDLAPVLMVAAALADGRSVFTHVKRLRDKESDRLAAMINNLRALGRTPVLEGDALYIDGGETFTPAAVDAYGDHRIAMAMSLATLFATGPVVLSGADHVTKSYPHFWEDYRMLGGKYHVI